MKNIIKKLSLYSAMLCIGVNLASCVNDLDVTPIDPSVNQTFNQNAVFAKIYAGFELTGLEGPAGNPAGGASPSGGPGYR